MIVKIPSRAGKYFFASLFIVAKSHDNGSVAVDAVGRGVMGRGTVGSRSLHAARNASATTRTGATSERRMTASHAEGCIDETVTRYLKNVAKPQHETLRGRAAGTTTRRGCEQRVPRTQHRGRGNLPCLFDCVLLLVRLEVGIGGRELSAGARSTNSIWRSRRTEPNIGPGSHNCATWSSPEGGQLGALDNCNVGGRKVRSVRP